MRGERGAVAIGCFCGLDGWIGWMDGGVVVELWEVMMYIVDLVGRKKLF